MKRFKKLTALALAVVMAVGMMAPAWATEGPTDDNNGTTPETVDTTPTDDTTGDGTDTPTTPSTGNNGKISITNAVIGATYRAYQMFDVDTIEDAEGGSNLLYTLPATSLWKDFFIGDYVSGAAYFTYEASSDGTYYIMDWKADMDRKDQTVQAFAQAAKAYAVEKGITPTGTETFEGDTSSGNTQVTTATISGLPAGYYLITSTGGSLCAVGTLSKNGGEYTFDDKQNDPTVVKEVWEDRYGTMAGHELDHDTGWGATNDADIGETVWYRATITAKGGAKNYTLLDFMYPGLTLNQDSFEVYHNKTSLGESNYSLTVNSDWNEEGTESNIRDTDMVAYAGDDNSGLAISEKRFTSATFAVHFEDSFLETVEEDDELVVIYSATLNENALISPNGNENIAILGYGNGNLGLHNYNILQQASQSMLAQANQSGQGVLSDDGDDGIAPYNMVIQHNIAAMTAGYRKFSMRSSTMTYTYELDVVKVNSSNNILTGATFQLTDERGNPIPLVPYTKPNVNWANWAAGSNNVLQLLQNDDIPVNEDDVDDIIKYYRPAKLGETGTVTEVTGGVFYFVGLDHGTYQLVETQAPTGYNKLKDPIILHVVSDAKRTTANTPTPYAQTSSGMRGARELAGTATLYIGDSRTGVSMTFSPNAILGEAPNMLFNGTGGVSVVNNLGNELPHTGGMGTTLFYVVGGVLVVGAGILLIVKKRMKNEE